MSAAFRRMNLINNTRETYYRRLVDHPRAKSTSLPCISFHGDFSNSPIGILVKRSFDRAMANLGGPPEFIRAIEGMSGQKYRTFINELVDAYPDAKYLEIGSWSGSTATSAIYGNKVKALCIDNWSQFGGPKRDFLTNIERVKSSDVVFDFIEADFRRVDYDALGSFNIYLFDGPHSERDQYDGIVLALAALEKSFVLIVDDWNWHEVRLGTLKAIRDAKLSILSSIEIRTSLNNFHPIVSGKNSDWHNGYYIGCLAK